MGHHEGPQVCGHFYEAQNPLLGAVLYRCVKQVQKALQEIFLFPLIKMLHLCLDWNLPSIKVNDWKTVILSNQAFMQNVDDEKVYLVDQKNSDFGHLVTLLIFSHSSRKGNGRPEKEISRVQYTDMYAFPVCFPGIFWLPYFFQKRTRARNMVIS